MQRVLVVAHGAGHTGYARVARAIMPALAARAEVHHFAIDVHGEPPPAPWTTYPNLVEGDPYGSRQLGALASSVRPDAVFVHHEPWVFSRYLGVLERAGSAARTVLYCAIEGAISDPEVMRAAFRADRLVAQTRFGIRELRHAADALGRAATVVPIRIPCGVDVRTFYPLARRPGATGSGCARLPPEAVTASRLLARRELAGRWPALDDAFVALNANADTARKHLEITLEGFCRFAVGKPPNVKLHLTGDTRRSQPRTRAMLDDLERDGRLLPSVADGGTGRLSDEQLNVVYNACDVGVNTASAEGWGLASHEHAAAGAAQIIPDYAGPGELWSEVALALAVQPLVSYSSEWFGRRQVRPETVAEALERAYILWRDGELEGLAARCYERAVAPELRWDSIGRRWSDVLTATTRG